MVLPTISPSPVVYAYTAEDTFDITTLLMVVLTLTDAPLDKVEMYEPFHTLIIDQDGSYKLLNEPYIPGELLLDLTRKAYEGRKASENNTVTL